jgi:lactobin A/cerein 7B family class IIb bacteriocin
MATINISDLHPTGSELFSDSESYMSELGDNELASVNGGILTSPVCAVVISRALIYSPRSPKIANSVIQVTKSIAKTIGL